MINRMNKMLMLDVLFKQKFSCCLNFGMGIGAISMLYKKYKKKNLFLCLRINVFQ